MKWALAGAVVVIAGLLFAMLTTDKKEKKKNKTTPQQIVETPKRVTRWCQDYSTTFLYGTNVVTVSGVEVTGLRKSTANLTYLIKVRNAAGNTQWMQRRSSWSLKGTDRKAAPSEMNFSGPGDRTLRLSFKWPRQALTYPGAFLSMTVPGEDRPEKALLGVRLPEKLSPTCTQQ